MTSTLVTRSRRRRAVKSLISTMASRDDQVSGVRTPVAFDEQSQQHVCELIAERISEDNSVELEHDEPSTRCLHKSKLFSSSSPPPLERVHHHHYRRQILGHNQCQLQATATTTTISSLSLHRLHTILLILTISALTIYTNQLSGQLLPPSSDLSPPLDYQHQPSDQSQAEQQLPPDRLEHAASASYIVVNSDSETRTEERFSSTSVSGDPGLSEDQLTAAASSSVRVSRQTGAPSTSAPSSQDFSSDQDSLDAGPEEEQQLQLQQPYDYHANMPVITKRELANAIKQATSSVDKQHAALTDMLLASQPFSATTSADTDPDSDASAELEVSRASGANSILLEPGSAGWLASSMFHKPAPDDSFVLNQTRQALISEETTRLLARQYKLTASQTMRGLPLISVDQTSLGKQCPRSAHTYSCIPGRYRSFSGHCNNVQQADWGSAQTPLVRYAPARYSDSISRPLRAARGPAKTKDAAGKPNVLPSAREVSLAVHEAAQQTGSSGSSSSSSSGSPDGNNNQPQQLVHSHMTTMLSFFGQFIFHDLALVPQFSKSIKCCQQQRQQQQLLHSECMPIEFKDARNNYCLDYVRSTPAVRQGCNLGPRDQLNLVSSFLDGSVIYGSSESQMRQLRSFSGGRLRSQRHASGPRTSASSSSTRSNANSNMLELLPQISLPPQAGGGNQSLAASDAHWLAAAQECYAMASMRRAAQQRQQSRDSNLNTPTTGGNCFQAGDIRVNENIGLTLMHTIWLREHNFIANKLAQLNRHWSDERLFEEARRIVVAELQHITYSEFLPSILGDEVMSRFNLTIASQGYSQSYDPQLNPGISNELATAVFPFILSTIPSTLERYSDRLEMLGATSLADTFMDASDLFKRNKFAQYLTGMMSQSAMEPALGLVPMTIEIGAGTGTGTGSRASPPTTSSGPAEANVTSVVGVRPAQVDAVAMAIQQGRDHGLRSYMYWRRVCQLRPQVRSWLELEQVMPAQTVARLRQVYGSIEHIDLYLALLENPAPGATVGPTLVCLLARQFYQLKHGDRYWFENDLPGLAFSPGQLDEIRQTSLAKVMCRNSQSSISFIQPAPMLASDPYLNAYQYCTNKAMTDLELDKWRQPVTSAQQVADEQLMNELMHSAWSTFGSSAVLKRGKRLIDDNSRLIANSLHKAHSQLGELASQEAARIKSAMAAKVRSRRQAASSAASNRRQLQHGHGHAAAGYRYLPRLKRQALSINNQSVIYELATNEVIRSLLRQGKDREQPQSIQSDIRDFLYSLETIQLDNLLDNSAASDNLDQFVASANSVFLTDEQRTRLATVAKAAGAAGAAGASTTAGDSSSSSSTGGGGRSNSISENCQDEDRVFPCDHTSPFRTITGWCNNLNQPKFGQSFTLHDRLLPNAYEDGLSKARQFSVVLASRDTGERLRLPSARLISTTMHDDRSNLHARYSLALMQFGQFGVDHDLTRTPFSVALDGSLLDCSACDSARTIHRDCMPIEIPPEDGFYESSRARAQLGVARKCLHFVRSLNAQPALGPRQQMNALTSYLDASEIYGSDNCEAKSLRSFVGGRLNSSAYPIGQQQLNYVPKEILPTTRLNPECVTPSGLCFHAGDQRASEQPGLTSIHTIFLRLHNSIVDQLAQLNRHWNDERLYQHGRRIVGAVLQRITYGEFAPRLLGLDYMSKFDLLLKQVGYAPADHYDDSCSASILTEFASAAFRMGHSLIRSAFPLLNRQYKPLGKAFQLRTAFFNSARILQEPQLIDSIMRGIVSTPVESLDNSITDELTNHLFERPREPFSGMDLISLNIQRARDHGIGGYNRYRVKCNLTRATNFDELSGEIPQRLIKRLRQLYASVDDIDLFTGGISEQPVHGGIIGPTFGCIIGMQLARLKHCDRFWHETGDPFVRFSAPQLAEIRKMSLAKVICSQSDTIDTIQRQAMDMPDNYLNPRVPCTSLPTMDLSVWRENQKSCLVNKIKIELGHSKRVNPCKSCTCTLEGPVCRTAKIDCVKMMRKLGGGGGGVAGLNQIMADKSCLVQCAWALEMPPL